MITTKENNRPNRPNCPGGQHRPAVGVSTFDGTTDAEHLERLRREYAELGEPFDEPRARRMMTFDIDGAWDCDPDVQWFNQQLADAVTAEFGGQAF